MEKISIDQYPKDTAPVVILYFNRKNPIVGIYENGLAHFVDEYGSKMLEYLGHDDYNYLTSLAAPTHFTYLQEEG